MGNFQVQSTLAISTSVIFNFLNSGNLICRTTGITMYFRESLGVQDNESRFSAESYFVTPPWTAHQDGSKG